MSFSSFEHNLIDFFKQRAPKDTYTVACSGGLDSMVLLNAMEKIKPVFKYDLKVLHVHHGASTERMVQTEFRDKALDFVKSFTEKNNLEFTVNKSAFFLESEEDCRNFRLEAYKNSKNLLTAHHKDDFLETLILRMIRGAGPQGLVDPFKKNELKPFLRLFDQKDISAYAQLNKLEWCQDPSNQSTDPLRNWVRGEWLPSLDRKIGKKGFEKSLLLISEALSSVEVADFDELIKFENDSRGFFNLNKWLVLDRFQKQSMIAHILLKVRKTGYTKGQIEEVVKQLDQVSKDTTFRSGKLEWTRSESKVLFCLDL